MANVLELQNVRKAFGSEVVLNNLSLQVPEHTATVLIGIWIWKVHAAAMH